MQKYDAYISLIKERLSEYRFIHSVNVAAAAEMLCDIYGGDKDKARLAGILHDVMKEESLDVQYDYIKRNGGKIGFAELNNPNIIHQISGAAYCRLQLGIEDEEVLSAIRWHTTGKADMSLLDKIIYTADFISAERNYPDADVMRSLAKQSLDDAMLYSLQYTINKLASNAKLIYPATLECYNSVVENKIKDKI